MTIELWQACLMRFETEGTASESLMAEMLIELSRIDDPRIAQLFDRFASQILEAAS